MQRDFQRPKNRRRSDQTNGDRPDRSTKMVVSDSTKGLLGVEGNEIMIIQLTGNDAHITYFKTPSQGSPTHLDKNISALTHNSVLQQTK